MYIIKTPVLGHELYFKAYEIEEFSSNTVMLTADINKAALFDSNDMDEIPFTVTDYESYYSDGGERLGIGLHVSRVVNSIEMEGPNKERYALSVLEWEFVKVNRVTTIEEDE